MEEGLCLCALSTSNSEMRTKEHTTKQSAVFKDTMKSKLEMYNIKSG